MQAAINAAGSTLPRNLPYPPTYSKVNPADTPIVTLALTSQTVSLRQLSDLADTLLAQRLSEMTGVGHVSIAGRHQAGGAHPGRPVAARRLRPRAGGPAHGDRRRQRRRARRARSTARTSPTPSPPTTRSPPPRPIATIVIAYRNGAPVLLRDVADVVDGLENAKVGGWYKGKPAVIIDIQRQPGANVIETVERIQAELPRLQRAMPAGAELTVVHDRTGTIRASIHDVQFTLVLSVGLVVLVVLHLPAHRSAPPSSPAWRCRCR